tara:strand:+ start:593 stop:976 length:384 start_codon:yes stop_codon:yes gene_type:complete
MKKSTPLPQTPSIKIEPKDTQKYIDFIDFCELSFGKEGVFDMGATRTHITIATEIYMLKCVSDSHIEVWGQGDATDRENIRKVLVEFFMLKWNDSWNQKYIKWNRRKDIINAKEMKELIELLGHLPM